MGRILILVFFFLAFHSHAGAQIQRRIPPKGIGIPADIRSQVAGRLAALRKEVGDVSKHPNVADADVLLKAVDLALRHGEIYSKKQLPLLDETLDLAAERIEALRSGKPSWTHDELTVRGFYSRIDDSPQPYGLVVPQGLAKDKPVPLYVWLHGRGDKTTDLHFIKQRLTKVGDIHPPGAIVLHPFGRQCVGYKAAGETDVLEAIAHVQKNYNIDPDRIALMGFSMGGAGAWHLGAHYADRFVAVSPGAGFAETARYQKLTKEQVAATPWYERELWKLYDVPDYVLNLFNVPTVVCYSGEKDGQIQAARVMEEAFASKGQSLAHVIGPGMGHKYDDNSLEEILSKVNKAVVDGRPERPQTLSLQTQTLKYPSMYWLHAERLGEHWKEATVTARIEGTQVEFSTENIRQLTIDPLGSVTTIVIDGDVISSDLTDKPITLCDRIPGDTKKKWVIGALASKEEAVKSPGLQGPIDDAFNDRFLVVTPDRTAADDANKQIEDWANGELVHLRDRWAALFRGTLPEKRADQVTDEDIQHANLVLFGTPSSNSVMAKVIDGVDQQWLEKFPEKHPFRVETATGSWIQPNPLNPNKYVVFNSGPTFRESHDRTNSLQNPKLPDWVIYDVTVPADGERAAKVVDAGFFDETWNLKSSR